MDNSLLIIEPENISQNFPDLHFRLQHKLVGHPLFEIERLLQLASDLPPAWVEFNSADADISQHPAYTPHTGLSLKDSIRNIEKSNSWVVLKYVDSDPEYNQLLQQCVSELAPWCEEALPGIHQLESYIFISSPGSTTPFHFDDEHNFLLQVRGHKNIHTWRLDSLGSATEIDLEHYYLGGHRNLPIRPNAQEADSVYSLNPGEGLHIPAHSTHWVKNGDEVSVSFSITFRSKALAQQVLVHRFNSKLRHLGIQPSPFGHSPILDHLKYWAQRLLTGLSHFFHRTRR